MEQLDIEALRMNRMYELLKIIDLDYIRKQNMNKHKDSIILKSMIRYFEFHEEYERCSYLLEIKAKLKNI